MQSKSVQNVASNVLGEHLYQMLQTHHNKASFTTCQHGWNVPIYAVTRMGLVNFGITSMPLKNVDY